MEFYSRTDYYAGGMYNPVHTEMVDRPDHNPYMSDRNYKNRLDVLFDLDLVDFGVQQGYVLT